MTTHKAALNVDAPVTLDELLDRNARETLHAGGADLGVDLSIVDRDARLLVGEAVPDEIAALRPEYEPVDTTIGDLPAVVTALLHEGDTMGILVARARPGQESVLSSVATHLHRLADAFIYDGIKRAMSARMHMATVEEANRELTEKNRRLAQAVERLQEADRVK